MRSSKYGWSCPTPVEKDASGQVTKWCDYKPGDAPTNTAPVEQTSQSFGGIVTQEERSRRIERQHSQDMAIQFLGLKMKLDVNCEVNLEEVLKLTDHFEKDLDRKV